VLNKRADTDFPKHNGAPCYASPSRYYPGSCFVVHAREVPCTVLDKPGGEACWIDLGWARTRTARICSSSQSGRVPAVVAEQDVQLAHLRPRSRPKEKETTLGRFLWAAIGWARFSIAVVASGGMERSLTTPVRGGEPVPRAPGRATHLAGR
jgi:hypothetical protein